jgi:hypothetical protein
MKLPETDQITKGLYLIGGLVILLVIYKILTGIGLLKTGKQKVQDKKKEVALSDFRTMEQFNINYTDDHIFKKIGLNAANLYSEQLRKAIKGIGAFLTDEEAIYSTFGKLSNKGNISEVAQQYFNRYKKDLRTDLLNVLDKNEILILSNIINELPEL